MSPQYAPCRLRNSGGAFTRRAAFPRYQFRHLDVTFGSRTGPRERHRCDHFASNLYAKTRRIMFSVPPKIITSRRKRWRIRQMKNEKAIRFFFVRSLPFFFASLFWALPSFRSASSRTPQLLSAMSIGTGNDINNHNRNEGGKRWYRIVRLFGETHRIYPPNAVADQRLLSLACSRSGRWLPSARSTVINRKFHVSHIG